MCTILGAAGDIAALPSKSRQEFHELLSCLFCAGELRGRDAAGFWVWRNNHPVYEKRPIPAQDLIFRSMGWKSLRFNPGELYMAHTRSTTDGDPNINANNHPHIGDHSVLVHNGMVFSYESIARSYGLKMKTDCDSEVLLRLAEAKPDMKDGLEHMMRVVHASTGFASAAVAVVDRRHPEEILLTRNSGNPLHIYQVERLNATFFCSTDAIFDKALEMLYGHKNFDNLGVDRTVVETSKLYRLKKDGTFTKEDLVNFHGGSQTGYHGGYGSSYGDYHGGVGRMSGASTDSSLTAAELIKQSENPFTYGRIHDADYVINLDGTVVEFIDDIDDDDDEVIIQDFEMFENMPEDVRKDLVEFLEENTR